MTTKPSEEAASKQMDRQIIRVESLPDQAGIAAALKRAFEAPPVPARVDHDEDPFAQLLKRIH